MILLDVHFSLTQDTAPNMKMQPQNGFLIRAFRGDMRDKELLRLIPFLAFLANNEDVRPVREWAKKFSKEPQIKYVDRDANPLILNRPKFIECLVKNLIDKEVKKLKIVSSGISASLSNKTKSLGRQKQVRVANFEEILENKQNTQNTSLHAKLLDDTDSEDEGQGVDLDLDGAYE